MPFFDLGTDVDWVLAGSGSLSSGSARFRTQLENAQRAYLSQSSDNMFRFVSVNYLIDLH